MRRRPSRPSFETFEDRVLTTAGVSAAGLPTAHALAPSIAQESFAAIALRNDTARPITYRILITPRNGHPTERLDTIRPGSPHPWLHPFPRGGSIPTFQVTYEATPGNPFSMTTTRLTPSVFSLNQSPSREYILQNAFVYRFVSSPNGTISLVSR